MKRRSEDGQGVLEYGGIILLVCVMALIILTVFGTQIEYIIDEIKWQFGFSNFDPVTAEEEAELRAYRAERAADEAEIAAEELAEGYTEIPVTQHGLSAHAGQAWNPATIAEYFDSGKCTPNQYSCDQDDFVVHYCELNPGKSIALVIGKTIRVIITGFMADTSYWTNRCGQTH
jgi:hypothetical protein